jgi:hypothetical protein
MTEATGILAAGANLLANALVLFGGTLLAGSDTRLLRKIERDVALLKDLPEAAKPVMGDLITYEIQRHADRRRRRSVRHVDSGNAWGIGISVVVSTLGCWGLAYLAMGHGWGWWIPFGVLAALGLLAVLGCADELFYYGDKPPDSRNDKQPPSQQEDGIKSVQTDAFSARVVDKAG